mmetsp:Transcript_1482/g.3095  ORF Transcript_1482/g.3095 Transcript_1482/m.3095 type:complete len:86 (+) Transcript_1482:53-310(+)
MFLAPKLQESIEVEYVPRSSNERNRKYLQPKGTNVASANDYWVPQLQESAEVEHASDSVSSQSNELHKKHLQSDETDVGIRKFLS